jgi:hypothetical protein
MHDAFEDQGHVRSTTMVPVLLYIIKRSTYVQLIMSPIKEKGIMISMAIRLNYVAKAKGLL